MLRRINRTGCFAAGVRDQEPARSGPFAPVGQGGRLQRIEDRRLSRAFVFQIRTVPTRNLIDSTGLANGSGQQGQLLSSRPVEGGLSAVGEASRDLPLQPAAEVPRRAAKLIRGGASAE